MILITFNNHCSIPKFHFFLRNQGEESAFRHQPLARQHRPEQRHVAEDRQRKLRRTFRQQRRLPGFLQEAPGPRDGRQRLRLETYVLNREFFGPLEQ